MSRAPEEQDQGPHLHYGSYSNWRGASGYSVKGWVRTRTGPALVVLMDTAGAPTLTPAPRKPSPESLRAQPQRQYGAGSRT